MSRKTRIGWANGLIALASLAGGVVLTNHYAPGALAGAGSTVNGGNGNGAGTGTTPAASGSGTATSDDIPYQFGDIKLTVTKANGKITAIDYGTSSASAGRDQAFPYLVQYAIQAQGSNFNNLSGATYTTDAFKQALDNALAKLG
jgi:uncharacterized protein with FMN-binding domain